MRGVTEASIAETVKNADAILTSLPHPRDVEAVSLEQDSIRSHARAGTVYFDLTTNSPSVV